MLLTPIAQMVEIEALAQEISEKTEGEKSLDDLTRALIKEKHIDLAMINDIVEDLIGTPADTLDSPLLK